MKRILLVVDHKWRDLPGSVYLKMLLEKTYHHRVVLARLGEAAALIPSLRPHVIVYNNLYHHKKNSYARYLKQRGVKIVILPTEGITFSRDQTVLFTHKTAGIDFVDKYLAWNRLMFDAILENHVLPRSTLELVGCGRLDFYRPPLKSLLKSRDYFRDKYGVNPDRKNVLVVSNYANAEFWPDTSLLDKNLSNQGALEIPAFSRPGALAKYEHEYRDRTFQLLREACKENIEANILLKYHPSENASTYGQLIEEIKRFTENVFLIEGEYIWDVLNISDVVVQRSSTVAIEAWLLGKHTIELELMPAGRHFLQPLYRDGSWRVRNASELVTLLERLDERCSIPGSMQDARDNILEKVVYKVDGKATARIANTLNEVARQAAPDFERIKLLRVKDKVKARVRQTGGMRGYDMFQRLVKLRFSDYLGRYDKIFTARDIEYWEEMLEYKLKADAQTLI
jgi:surface carbohydrate biosynthesis protein